MSQTGCDRDTAKTVNGADGTEVSIRDEWIPKRMWVRVRIPGSACRATHVASCIRTFFSLRIVEKVLAVPLLIIAETDEELLTPLHHFLRTHHLHATIRSRSN